MLPQQPRVHPVSINSSTFTNPAHTQRKSLHVFDIDFERFRALTLPQFLPIPNHKKLYLRLLVTELIINPDERDEAVVRPIQLKLNLGIRRHADALLESSSADIEPTAVEVAIELRLPPTRRQTHRIQIGKKHLRRLDLPERER